MDDDDFIPEDPIGPVAEKKPILNRLALFVAEHLFTVIIVALVLGLIVVVWRMNTVHTITPAQMRSVQPGMTPAEVEKALGFPSTGPAPFTPTVDPSESLPITWRAWEDGRTTLVVGFVDGRVRYKESKTVAR